MKTINATTLKQMLISGANNLFNHYPEIDRLNVFPVPDGDTGMNMNLTITSGMKEIQNRNDESVYALSKAFSMGLLMGARGNSGVITSQIFSGFAEGLKDIPNMRQITVSDFIKALENGKEVAYKAVSKPVEGTILTVIRESSDYLLEKEKDIKDIETLMKTLLNASRESLKGTPSLLPILKEVGVVDSGGTGLMRIFEGMEKAINDEVVERLDNVETSAQSPEMSFLSQADVPLYAGAQLSEDEEGYGYCTQFVMRLAEEGSGKKPYDEKRFQKFLTTHGKSVVLAQEEDIVKVHVHTLTPGNMLNYAQQFGEFVSITIENMSEEHHNIEQGRVATDMAGNIEEGLNKKKEHTKFGVVAVSSGDGLDEIFRELGVNEIVTGGQTMNPSTQDFVSAIEKLNAENVFILPNNGNIVMAATQACEVFSGKTKVRVIPSETIPEGIASLMMFSSEGYPEDVYNDMSEAVKNVRSGSITYAIKDTEIDGVQITKDQFMAMRGKRIVCCKKDPETALKVLLDSMIDSSSYSVSIYAGADVKDETIAALEKDLNVSFGDKVDILIRRGNQPVYSYLIGVE